METTMPKVTDDEGRSLDWSGATEPPLFIAFNGRKYRLNGSYYRAENWGKGAPSLHRAVYEHSHGPIPEGHEVHHKDESGINNDPSNLEALDAVEHQRMHTKQRQAAGLLKPPSDLARERAAEWHASPDGLEWHSAHSVEAWKQRSWTQVSCHECGQPFRTPYPTRAKFCHLNCKMMAFRRKRGDETGTRPHRMKSRPLVGKREAPEDIA